MMHLLRPEIKLAVSLGKGRERYARARCTRVVEPGKERSLYARMPCGHVQRAFDFSSSSSKICPRERFAGVMPINYGRVQIYNG